MVSTTWDQPTIFSSAALLAALLLPLLLHLLRRKTPSPPSLPGPSGLPLLGSLPFLDPELHSYFTSLSKTHGPVFKIKLGTKTGVVVSSPSAARDVLRTHDATFANRDVPAAALAIAYGGRDIVWNPDVAEWRMLRKVCVREMLGPASLEAVYGLRRRELRRTVAELRARAGEAVDVGTEMFTMVMNVIMSMLWGGTLVGSEERAKVGDEFRKVVGEITELLGSPNVSDFFPILRGLDLQGVERRMRGLFERFDEIFNGIIEKRVGMIGMEEGEKDFLDFMLKLVEEGGESKTAFTMVNLKALLMDMVVGGTDTTSNTVEWAIAHLMANPAAMSRSQSELDVVVGTDAVVEESHTTKLPYLRAVMKEVLRLHPALPLLVPHRPSEPATVAGYTVPKDARVFVNVWAIHRDGLVWEDPLEFRPERFLGEENERRWDFSGNDFDYFPFGSGRRICAGIAMAERTFMWSLATLVHSFDWGMRDGDEGLTWRRSSGSC
ncbi:Cytochrome P450 76C4 [Acorus calamus]|uniref:Cytochrome P450 76C4 n=1 Tax=Acorus calamus TaxID=4465 RepID=A0AAV9CDY7_ACOCL|nr:Cytochrome P450 76C4 [Acorus calamus]